MNPEVAANVCADVGEGPAWIEKWKCLLFVDISRGLVYKLEPSTGGLSSFAVGQEVSAAITSTSNGLVLAARDGIFKCSPDGSNMTLVVPINEDDPSIRLNDAKCDPAGNLWVGSMAFDFRAGAASLYRIDHNRAIQVLSNCSIANGLGWSPDGSLMYFVDSPTHRIDVMDYNIATCSVSNRRPFAVTRSFSGMPDGLTVDSEGGIWVALFGGGKVLRYDARGRLSEVIEFPTPQVTSCCFGGDELTDLYVTSAAYQMDAAALREHPLSGATFVTQPGVTGLPTTNCRLQVDLA